MKKHLLTILFFLLSLSAFSQEQRKEYIVQSNPFLVGEIYKTYRFKEGRPVEVIPNLRLEKSYDVQVTTAHKDNIKIYTVGDRLYILSEMDLKKVKRGELPLPEPLITFTLEEEFFISLRNEQNAGTSVTYLREGLEGNSTLQTKAYKLEETTGDKRYELKDHLGNVQVTVTDKLIPRTVGSGLDIQKHYAASVISASDYYPFGMAIADRSKSSPSYRYGFNGMEKDDERYGEGSSYDFGARIYDARIGRFLSRDPLSQNYPTLSPYHFANNSPIFLIDINGEEGVIYIHIVVESNVSSSDVDLAVSHANQIYKDLNVDLQVEFQFTSVDGLYSLEEFQQRKDYSTTDSYQVLISQQQLEKDFSSEEQRKGWTHFHAKPIDGLGEAAKYEFFSVINTDKLKEYTSNDVFELGTSLPLNLSLAIQHESLHPKSWYDSRNDNNGHVNQHEHQGNMMESIPNSFAYDPYQRFLLLETHGAINIEKYKEEIANIYCEYEESQTALEFHTGSDVECLELEERVNEARKLVEAYEKAVEDVNKVEEGRHDLPSN